VFARLSLFYGPIVCVCPPLCLTAHVLYIRVLCHMGLAACNKSSFVRSFVREFMMTESSHRVDQASVAAIF